MAKNCRTVDFKLENMRASYPSVIKPRKRENNGVVTFKYELTLIYPKSVQLVGLTASKEKVVVSDELMRICVEHWGDKAVDMLKNELIKNPILDGDGKDGMNKSTGVRNVGMEGHRFIRTSANASDTNPAPQVRSADGRTIVTDPNVIYPGCYVNAVVNAYTWENKEGGKGISFGLSAVQFYKDGERLGGTGGVNPDGFFDAVPDAGAMPAEAKGGAGAGGFFA